MVIAIIAVGAVLAYPNFQGFVANNRLTSQSNKFVGTVNTARSEAATKRVEITIEANDTTSPVDWSQGWSAYGDIDNDATTPDELIAEVKPFEGQITLLGTPDTVSTLTVSPNGRVQPALMLVMCDSRTGEKGRLLNITTTGRVEVSNKICP